MARSSLKNVCRLIDAAVESLPPEKDFLADLKRSIELTDKKESKKPSMTYKPSSMNCIRNMYYQVTGADVDEGTSSYQLIGICNSGTDTHVRIQTAVSKMIENGIDCEYIDVEKFVKERGLSQILQIVSKSGMETKLFHKALRMSFLCDGIIKYKGQYYILELKTESSFKWQSRTDVDSSHYNQGTAYSIAFGLNRVLFVYINRDTLDMKSYMFEVTGEMKQELVDRINKCEQYVNIGCVPSKPDDVPKKTCEYCSYKTLCRGD